MAEELDIRSIWNSSKEREDPTTLQINMMERKSTKTTLYWVKFILWIEFWLTVVGGPFATVWIHSLYQSLAITVGYSLLCIAYLFYYSFLIRAIRNFRYHGNVVHNLRKVYRYLRFYLLHYKVVIWLSLLAGILISIFGPENQEVLKELSSTRDWAIFIGVMTVMFGIMGGIMTSLIHLIYGRKIKRLRNMIRDLESEA